MMTHAEALIAGAVYGLPLGLGLSEALRWNTRRIIRAQRNRMRRSNNIQKAARHRTALAMHTTAGRPITRRGWNA